MPLPVVAGDLLPGDWTMTTLDLIKQEFFAGPMDGWKAQVVGTMCAFEASDEAQAHVYTRTDRGMEYQGLADRAVVAERIKVHPLRVGER